MNKTCRICLEEGVLSSIFTQSFNVSLCDMIQYCCNIKVTKGDGLPEFICGNCIYKLGIAFHFKSTCEGADIHLRQHLGIRGHSKFNDAEVMTDPLPPARTIIVKKCKCKLSSSKKSSTNYKKKSESEKLKRGPKPKPKQTHSCYECHKEFRCQAQLEMHVRTHTGVKPFACMFCPRSFTQKHNLTIHLRVHTGEKPFQCDVCSKTFSAQGNLQAHLKIHTGQKDHQCMLCQKSFITSSELTRHMVKHQGKGVKNFKCDICGAGYSHTRNLKLHKQKKHAAAATTECLNQNNTGHIDIIGLDVDKETPLKDVNHLIPHIISEKPHLMPSNTNHSIAYEEKPKMFSLNPLSFCQTMYRD